LSEADGVSAEEEEEEAFAALRASRRAKYRERHSLDDLVATLPIINENNKDKRNGTIFASDLQRTQSDLLEMASHRLDFEVKEAEGKSLRAESS